MNKNDIFIKQWRQDKNNTVLHISLFWDTTKCIELPCTRKENTKDIEETAIGKMFNEYGDNIIEHILRNTIEKCAECGIILLHKSHLCDPERPMPFNFNNVRQEACHAHISKSY